MGKGAAGAVTYWVGFAVWCGVFGGLVLIGLWRYATRGTWQERGLARVRRVWEADPVRGWRTTCTPGCRRGPGDRRRDGWAPPAATAAAADCYPAWPGREVAVWVRTRRPDLFRVAAEPATFVLRHGALVVPGAALLVFPLLRLVLAGVAASRRSSCCPAARCGRRSSSCTSVVNCARCAAGSGRCGPRRPGSTRAGDRRGAWRIEEDRGNVGDDTPVVAFTTLDQRQVTALCEPSLRTNLERGGSNVPLLYGRVLAPGTRASPPTSRCSDVRWRGPR